MEMQDSNTLFSLLRALNGDQLEQLILSIPDARQNVTEQANIKRRVNELRKWAESSVGPGIAEVQRRYEVLIGSRNPAFIASSEPRIWNAPAPSNSFYGRDAVIDKLHETLRLHGRAALVGMPGIGKTQVALAYAHRFRNLYTAVLWITAETETSLHSGFVILASRLHLAEAKEADQNAIVNAVLQWFENHTDWLLVFDNVVDMRVIAPLLPTSPNGRLVLISRDPTIRRVASIVLVEKMDVEEATLCLLCCAGITEPASHDEEAARMLAQELDGLPLALDQAGAYMAEVGKTPAQYHALYQRHAASLRKRSGTGDYPHSVFHTFSLALEEAERTHPDAADVLRLCAFLFPEIIPEEIFTTKVSGHAGRSNPFAEELMWDETVMIVRRLSLLSRTPQDRTLSVHRLVQAVICDTLTADERRYWAQTAVRLLTLAFPSAVYANWSRCERLLLQARTCVALIDTYNLHGGGVNQFLHNVAWYLAKRAQFKESELLYIRALALAQQDRGADHMAVATIQNNLGTLYTHLRRYAEAEEMHLQAFHIRQNQYGPEHEKVATSLHNLASVYDEQGNYAKAQPLYQQALAIREKMLGVDHPDTALTLNNLAASYNSEGRYKEALALHHRAIDILTQSYGEIHPEIAMNYHNMATLYQSQYLYAEAEKCYKKAGLIWQQTVGDDHPNLAATLRLHASLLHMLGRKREAEVLHARAKAIEEASGDKTA